MGFTVTEAVANALLQVELQAAFALKKYTPVAVAEKVLAKKLSEVPVDVVCQYQLTPAGGFDARVIVLLPQVFVE